LETLNQRVSWLPGGEISRRHARMYGAGSTPSLTYSVSREHIASQVLQPAVLARQRVRPPAF
jgi:hypothetical protein